MHGENYCARDVSVKATRVNQSDIGA
jgi:hypothetical protein